MQVAAALEGAGQGISDLIEIRRQYMERTESMKNELGLEQWQARRAQGIRIPRSFTERFEGLLGRLQKSSPDDHGNTANDKRPAQPRYGKCKYGSEPE